MSALISPPELQKILQQFNVRILDASYNLPPSSIGIAGAQNFNIDDIADPISPFAHTVPTAEIFAQKAGALGIGNDDLVVIYDRGGIAMAAARAWWMFRLFGHENVKILNGGLPAWIKAGYPTTEKSLAPPAPAVFRVNFREELLKQTPEINNNLSRKEFTVLDARDTARFTAGHIPNSLNVPYTTLLNNDGTLKEQPFKPPQGNLACTCGSGVTACVVALALFEMGRTDTAIYDGSWTEWGADPKLPKAQGI